ncbi:MAG: hypothetical protein JO307_05515 [Bryobacterales bacterium]|nr:hypothetical protein [Bryobacterales bacterium]
MRSIRIWCVLIAALLPVPAVHGQILLPQVSHDERSGLVIHYPKGWWTTDDSPGFEIVSFPPNKRPPVILVPDNEAQIAVVCQKPDPGRGGSSIRDWLRSYRVTSENGFRITESRVVIDEAGSVPALRTEKDLEPQFPRGVKVGYDFPLAEKLCDATLWYRGQARAVEFEAILLAIIKHLEPDAGSRKPGA